MKAYLTRGRWLSCSNSTVSKWNQWDLRTYEYAKSARERFLTHILDRISPRSSSKKPTVAHWIDTWMHLLAEYTQKLAPLLETDTVFQYSEILFWIFLHTSMYSPKRMFYWELVDTFYSFISSTYVRSPKFLSRYVPSVCVCTCVHAHTCACVKTTSHEQCSKERHTHRLIIHIKPCVGG